MKLAARLAALCLVACHGGDPRVTRPGGASPRGAQAAVASAGAAPAITPPDVAAPVTAPHGGEILRVAITDRGDAALTSDTFSELRLWPALDGTREPVVVHGPAARQLALGRDGDGLCAAVLDPAGSVTLLRFDARGGERGRVQLPVQPSIRKVVAVPGGVLVHRADHAIERFDPHGVLTGRLVPAAGQRVVSLAARRDRAVAGITGDGADRATSARMITLGQTLAWGASFVLPQPLADLAIAPGGGRLAGLAVHPKLADEIGEIVEIEPEPVLAGVFTLRTRRALVSKGGRVTLLAPPTIGFVDDDNVAFGAPGELEWLSRANVASWSSDRRAGPDSELAVADLVVAGHGAALELSELAGEHYLGYRWVNGDSSSRFRTGHGVMLQIDSGESGMLWLDARLDAERSVLEPAPSNVSLVLDDRHVLFTMGGQGGRATSLIIRDVTSRIDTEIAVLAGNVTATQYDPGTRVLAVALDATILRYRLAVAPVAATPLRALSGTGERSTFYLIDPARAHGMVAVVRADGRRAQALIYRLDGDDGEGPPLAPERIALAGQVAAVDRAGTLYAGGEHIVAYPDGRASAAHAAPAIANTVGIGEPSHDGARFAAGHAGEVIVFDAGGAVRWRQPVWQPGLISWSLDDATVFVAAGGGAMITFDARTGERLAMRCGWGFGRYERDVTASANAPSACAAP